MKAKKLTLMTLALATVSLAACNDNNQKPNSNGGAPTSSASNVYVDFISADANKTLPFFKVNETIDLADYYNVEYSDGSTDKNFTVSVYEKDQASVLIEGTKVTVKKTGVYDLTLKAGQFESMITIDCRSEKGIEVINFFKKLQANPTNYTVDLLDISNSGALSYGGETAIHTDNYFIAFNKDNPGELDENGDANSVILAKLSDGKGYWGNFKADGDVEFHPGDLGSNWGNYYVNMPLSIDGALFTSTFDKLGDETITAGKTVTETLHQTALPMGLKDNYEFGETEIVELGKNDAGEAESATFVFYVYAKADKNTPLLAWGMTLRDIGTSKNDKVDAAAKNPAYLPQPLEVSEMKTAFGLAKAATNYTVTTKIVAADRNGQEVAQPDDTYAYTQFFGTANALTEVTTVTAEGIESVLKDGDKVLKKIAFFNRGGKAYEVSGALNAQDEMEYTSKELTGDSAVASAEAAVYTTAAFTDAAIDAGLWTKKVAKNDGTYLITGKVGDNDGTTASNLLYKQMMDQMALVQFKDSETNELESYGTYYTSAIKGWDAAGTELHALTINSTYEGITVNPTTGEITALANIQCPASSRANLYWNTTYSISAIGATQTADFSGYTIA